MRTDARYLIAGCAALALALSMLVGACAPLETPTGQPGATASATAPDITGAPGQDATQVAVATLVAYKLTDAAGFEMQLTTSPRPTTVPGPTGISTDENQKIEWAKLGLNVENTFGGRVDGNLVGIWAGSLFSDPDQGIIEVLWSFPYRNLEAQIETPGKHGSIHITEEHNNRLTLVSTGGTTFYFDVPGLQFVPSLTEVVPTITPPSTYTPVLPSTAPVPTSSPPPTTQESTFPPRIETSEAGYAQTMQAFRLTITPATNTPGIPPTPTPEPFIPGIYNGGAAPVPRSNYSMTNWWQDLVNGERVEVFAGARQDNTIYPRGPAQGLVFVDTTGADLISYVLQEYDAPSGTGVLTITAVSASRLTLQADNGGTLYFDVPSRQFVDSLSTTSTAPTATLLPTILPDIEAPSPTATPYPYPQQTAVATSAP